MAAILFPPQCAKWGLSKSDPLNVINTWGTNEWWFYAPYKSDNIMTADNLVPVSWTPAAHFY